MIKSLRTVLCTSLFSLMLPTICFSQTAVAKYPFKTNANDISGNGYNGTLTSTTNTTDRFGNSNAALSFTSGVSSGTLPVSLVTAMQNDFTVGFWFKTSMIAASGAQWYNGSSLMDAEVGGVTNDWGITLIDGGKVCFGIGNPDMTIKSTSATYNDNAWHFVTGTRNKAAGTIILYIDGAAINNLSGLNTAALNAPSVVGLGRSSAVSSGTYTGVLDDMLIYNSVLSAAQVSGLYASLVSFALPVKWESFTAQQKDANVILNWKTDQEVNNDHFNIEDSRDGIHFSGIGSLPANQTDPLYSFTAINPSAGEHYYRIKQTDKDGSASYSKTVVITLRKFSGGFYLQTNPASNTAVLQNPGLQFIRRIQLTDMNGKIIRSKPVQSGASQVQVDISSLAAGYYLLNVFTAAGINSIPLIKQ
jgi:Concanavalin A-like lectin/glucanases superfamily/Secretion system C-terminal sorting domain